MASTSHLLCKAILPVGAEPVKFLKDQNFRKKFLKHEIFATQWQIIDYHWKICKDNRPTGRKIFKKGSDKWLKWHHFESSWDIPKKISNPSLGRGSKFFLRYTKKNFEPRPKDGKNFSNPPLSVAKIFRIPPKILHPPLVDTLWPLPKPWAEYLKPFCFKNQQISAN